MRGRVDGRRSDLLDFSIGIASVAALAGVGFAVGRASAPSARGGIAGRITRGGAEDSLFRPGHEPDAAAGMDDRGRQADTPSAMPAKGWVDILWRTYREFSEDRLMLVAAGITFYVLLALFPAITAMVSIYGLFTDVSAIREQTATLSGLLPAGAVDIIGEQMTRVSSHDGGKLGFGMVFGLVLALWSANAGMKTLFDALNIVYEEKEKRGFLRLNLVTLCFTLGTIVVLILALSSVVLLPVVLEFTGLGALETWLLLLRWPVLLLMVAGGLSLIYRAGPSREAAKWRWLSGGAALAALLWVAFSILFSWYVQNFGSYDETYGSLGAAIGFMTWIWISTTVVLLGAELNAELEHQTARDTTRRPARPMGRRGAEMADSLGEAKA